MLSQLVVEEVELTVSTLPRAEAEVLTSLRIECHAVYLMKNLIDLLNVFGCRHNRIQEEGAM